MRYHLIGYVLLAALVLLSSPGCRKNGEKPQNANRTENNNKTAPDNSNVESETRTPEIPPPPPTDDPDYALIMDTENDVQIKFKDTQTFVPVLQGPFNPGDTLSIGANSRAIISCKDVCELTTMGTYTACCTSDCKLLARGAPPEIAGQRYFMSITDRPQQDQAAIADSAQKLRELHLGETTTQFLIADLYSKWKLKEAEVEINTLSHQLEKPEARQELGNNYAPFTRKTGDMFVMINKNEKAIQEYRKPLILKPEATVLQPVDPREKAAAHVRLADIYTETGKKVEAEENSKAAKNIYLMQGDTTKAAAVDRKIQPKIRKNQ